MKKLSAILIVLCLPLLLGNRSCERSTTWGKKYFTKWEDNHVAIDESTKCSDCHDDNRTPKVKPKSHDLAWKHEHGKYANQRIGFKDQNVCYLCHDEPSCNRCHQEEAPQNHNEFWKLKGHGAMTALDRSRCEACHTSTDFCERCHANTKPVNHSGAWGSPSQLHCLNCHYPVESAGAQKCNACHLSTPSHDATPAQPNNGLHVPGADCRGCHAAHLGHPDNGSACTTCHQ